jgi:hypothetical protein
MADFKLGEALGGGAAPGKICLYFARQRLKVFV